jgi:hypothetical protein
MSKGPIPRDITGQKFGRLSVLDRAGRAPNGGTMWKCLCECGTEKVVSGSSLVTGHTESCGCLQKERVSAYNTKLLIPGQRFGRWTVLEQGRNKGGSVCWLCQCDCGEIKEVSGHVLRSGESRSCGCLHAFGRARQEAREAQFYNGRTTSNARLRRFTF